MVSSLKWAVNHIVRGNEEEQNILKAEAEMVLRLNKKINNNKKKLAEAVEEGKGCIS